jgi:hypothetical protein
MTFDLDLNRLSDADCNGVSAVRVQHSPIDLGGLWSEPMQSFVQCADRTARKIELDH